MAFILGVIMPITYTPQGKIRLGNVPWDNTYQHVRLYNSTTEQATEIGSHMDSTLNDDTYTYVRKDSQIIVPYNAERLYTKNYVMYQNSNYGTKWFYAFITDITYVNENATALQLETDVWQTYMFDLELKPGFIERTHVKSDLPGEHRIPEPEMPIEYITADRWTDSDLNDMSKMWCVIQTNAEPWSEWLDIFDPNHAGSRPKVGGWYCNVFNGGKYYAFTRADGGHGADDGIFWFLDTLNRAGAAESVTNIFMFPQKFIPANQRGSDKGLPEDQQGYGYEVKWHRPTNLNNYVPRNNKLFTYPYTFCRVDNNNGQQVELKFEDWNGYTLSVQTTLDPDACIMVIPQNYEGIANNVPQSLNFPFSVKCSWVYSSYQTWSAQNALLNALSIGASVAMMALPAAKGVGAAVKAAQAGRTFSAGTKARLAHRGTEYGKALTNAHVAKYNRSMAEIPSMGKGDMLSMGAGMLGLGTTLGEIDKQSKVPDTQKGSANGNTLFGLKYMTFNISDIVPRPQYCQQIDDFFDMFGYAWERIDTPFITSRRSWNYIKMQGAQHRGNIPAPELALINSCFDSGITFWHTWDISNYDLNNDIVNW